MISVIICSRQKGISQELLENITATVGVKHELVVIDNSKNDYSLFSAYNEGIRRASGNILCFCHDDIMFRCSDWGETISKHFEKYNDLGLLGVAGSHFLPSVPMYWSSSPFISEHNLNIDQGIQEEFFHEDYFQNKDIVEVVAVDGLCFFVRRDLFEIVRFDEDSYYGFHLYDMDICLQVISAGKKVMVCRDVLIEHSWSESKSANNKGQDLLKHNLSIFCNKWADILPIARGIYLPDYTVERINRLCVMANDAFVARQSRAYRLGRFLLKPFRRFLRNK